MGIFSPKENKIIWYLYYILRSFIPIQARWFLQRQFARRVNGFLSTPMWPLPEVKNSQQSMVEGNGLRFPFILTHDVDTQFGFDHIQDVCEVEKRLELKSSWNIVPNLYQIGQHIMEYLRESRMEIGVHDWNHDGKLFSNKKTFYERIGKINEVIRDWGAKGFRAGTMFHHDEWTQELECDYDSSYYDTDPFQPMGGGDCSIWPFMLGHLVELPYTMPQDHVLFVAKAEFKILQDYHSEDNIRRKNWEWMIKYTKNLVIEEFGDSGADPEIVLKGIDIWKMKAEWLVNQGGMVLMITHPDYLCHPKLSAKSMSHRAKRKYIYDGWLDDTDKDLQEVREKGIIEAKWYGSLLEQYAAFLNWFKREYEGQYWHCLPWELADWYKDNRINELRD